MAHWQSTEARSELSPAMLFKPLLVIVLSVSGVLCQWEGGVTYTPERICALKGSSVDMRCTYSYPTSHTVQKTFWFIYDWNSRQMREDLSKDPEYSDRVEYLGNKNSDCTFRINQLRKTDSGTYRFGILDDHIKYTSQFGVTLEVTDLQVMVNPDTVKEGQSVRLNCRTTCTLTGSPAFIWYRDGSPLPFTDQSHQFRASSGDAGKYSCAVKGYEHLRSPAYVIYPPKSVSVSVSSSGEIMEGSSVTLTCNSDASPPLQRYTWYKNNRALSSLGGSKWGYTIYNIKSGDAGEYYCEAENAIGTDRSPHINLKVLYRPKNTAVSVSPSGEIVEGSSVTLICSSSDANPPVQRYTWYKNNRAVSSETGGPVDSYTIKSVTLQDAGEYTCVAENGIGTNRSPPKGLDVQYPPNSVSVSVSSSGEIVEGSSVTLTCSSSDANPPVKRYTWYKNNRTVSSETGGPEDSYTIKNITLQDAGEYYCGAGNGIGTNRSPPKRLDVQSALQVTVQGGQSLIAAAAVGVPAILALVFLGVVCLRRRKSRNETEGGRQGNKSPIDGNVSGMAMSHTGTQDTDRDDGEVPLYASVQPANTRNQERLLPSTVQKPLPQCEEGVQYASIQIRPSSAAPRSPAPSVKEDCVLYSTLRKLDK